MLPPASSLQLAAVLEIPVNIAASASVLPNAVALSFEAPLCVACHLRNLNLSPVMGTTLAGSDKGFEVGYAKGRPCALSARAPKPPYALTQRDPESCFEGPPPTQHRSCKAARSRGQIPCLFGRVYGFCSTAGVVLQRSGQEGAPELSPRRTLRMARSTSASAT